MNRNQKLSWGIILALILIVAGVSLAKTSHPLSGAKPYTLGVIFPLSGGTADFYGEAGRRGIELAKEEINSHGGINGRPITFDYADSQGLTKSAVSAVKELIARNRRIIIGDIVSGGTLAIAPITEQQKILLITPGSASPKVSQAGDYVFRTRLAANIESKAVVSFIMKDLAADHVDILYQNTDYGSGVIKAFGQDLAEANGYVVIEEKYELGATDFRTQLAKMKASPAKVVMLAGYATDIGRIMKQARELNLNKTFIAHSAAYSPDIVKAGGPATDGLIVLSVNKLNPIEPQTKKFLDQYQTKYREDPDIVAPIAYDTVMVLADKMKKCSEDTDCLKKQLYKTKNFPGITGPISFDQNGDLDRYELTPMTIKGGQFQPYP